jgi:hypothetical protein
MHTGRFLPVMSGPRLPIGLLDRFTPDELARMRHIERVYQRTATYPVLCNRLAPVRSLVQSMPCAAREWVGAVRALW